MEDTLREAPSADDWRTTLARRIHDQRQRSRERIDAQRERLGALESRLSAQFDAVVHELTCEQQESQAVAVKADARNGELTRRASELEERAAELTKQQERIVAEEQTLRTRAADLERQAAELSSRQSAAAVAASQTAAERAALEAAQAAAAAEADRLRNEALQVSQAQQEVALRQQQLDERQKETQRQRRQIAQQLRAKKHELTAEIERHRSEALAGGAGQEVQLQLRLAELQGKLERMSDDLALREQQRDEATQRAAELKGRLEARQSEIDQQRLTLEQGQRRQIELEGSAQRAVDLERRLAELRKENEAALSEAIERAAARQAEAADAIRLRGELERQRSSDQAAWDRERTRLENELAAVKKSSTASGDLAGELNQLREENKQLEAWLAEAEERAKSVVAGTEGGQELDDLRRRFEMAVQDVRELKTKNSELTEQLANARKGGGPAPITGGSGGDWESLKKKLLAQLETDFEETDERQVADRLTVEGTIKITDEMLARKEAELQELKQLLDSQSQNMGEVAVGAAAIAQVLDTDELVRQERDNLQRMQENLREQLRKAEVDISLERAKLARERAELDERLRAIEAAGASAAADAASSPPGKGGKSQPPRGKWLTRLGLQGKDE